MGGPKKHHFVPKFLLKPWTYDEKNLWLYLKSNIEESPRSASIADVGHERNLYTSRGGDKSVETDFFSKIDGDASAVLKNIIENGKRKLDQEDKIPLIHFVNTFHIRSPELINEMRNFNNSVGKGEEGEIEKNLTESRNAPKKVFEKEPHDDTPKLVQLFSTIGKNTAMSKSYEHDFKKLISSNMMIYENNSSYDFITSDFPLRVINLSREESFGIEIPTLYGMIFPLSPKLCLIISNDKEFIKEVITSNQKEFVKKTNIETINTANNQIFSKEKILKEFIKKHLWTA